MTDQCSHLSNYLKDLRTCAGLTLLDVAKHMGGDYVQFVWKWENDLAYPPIEKIRKLAKLYKVDAEEMFEVIKDHIIYLECKKIKDEFDTLE